MTNTRKLESLLINKVVTNNDAGRITQILNSFNTTKLEFAVLTEKINRVYDLFSLAATPMTLKKHQELIFEANIALTNLYISI